MTVKTPIYLDFGATTPIDPRVLEVLQKIQRDHFGNAASSSHAFGWSAAKLVDIAREHVAALIGATAREIVFTSGATESNNLAIFGVTELFQAREGHLAYFELEHEAVSGPMIQLGATGRTIRTITTNNNGFIELDNLHKILQKPTLLVSVMAAQNEIGTIQPIKEIGQLCRDADVLFHCDAAQAVGKIPVDVMADNISLLSISSHKLYGPKGVGALYVRSRNPRVSLLPRMFGGGQERSIRPGTINVPGVVAFGEACRLSALEMNAEATRLTTLRNQMWEKICADLDGVILNGALENRLPGNLNISVEGVQAHRLVGALTTLAVSSSSACSSNGTDPSLVLTALGLSDQMARASLRIGIGRTTTAAELDFATEKIISTVKKMRPGT